MEPLTPDQNEWFETVRVAGMKTRRRSKFRRKDFSVSVDYMRSRWQSWSSEDKHKLAAAFSARDQLSKDDRDVLDYLIEQGDPPIWRTLALSIVKNSDRNRAVGFVIARVMEGVPPLANYYQAMALLMCNECVPALIEKFRQHSRETTEHAELQRWEDRLAYVDYLSCAAALFKITGQQQYLANLKAMVGHEDETVRKMARAVADTMGISMNSEN